MQFEGVGTIILLVAIQSIQDGIAPVFDSLARLAQAKVVAQTDFKVLQHTHASTDIPVDSKVFATESSAEPIFLGIAPSEVKLWTCGDKDRKRIAQTNIIPCVDRKRDEVGCVCRREIADWRFQFQIVLVLLELYRSVQS